MGVFRLMLFLDLETYCELDIRHVSLDRYASHPSTRILMCAYCVDAGEMQFWQEGEDRTELDRLIMSETCVAWNKGFEETLIEKVWKIRAHAWLDAMVLARYAGLPAGLKDCNRVPFFAGESVTTKETLLINKFCKPSKSGALHNAETDPEDWAAFCDYCRRDVLDTRLIYGWLVSHFPMPSRVHKTWLLDQKINRRGMPVDLELCWNAKQEADRLQDVARQQLAALTGLDNPNSVTQLLKWVSDRGYPFNGLGKELVKRAVEEMPDGEAKDALRLRLAGAKSSVKKLSKILEQVSPDRRLREQYRFYGAHTGRWSGKGAQLQNLPRKKPVAAALEALLTGKPVASLDDLTTCIRPIITAPKGKKIVLADFKSVENRVLAWVAGCDTMMQVYKDGRDPYIDFAARMENIPYEAVSAEMRQIAKPGTLGCGFGLGGGKEQRRATCTMKGCKFSGFIALQGVTVGDVFDCPNCHARTYVAGEIQKSGLWRYAEMMGIELTQEQAHKQVAEFRTAFAEVCEFWYWLEEAYVACCKSKREQTVGVLKFVYKDPALRIVTPNGCEIVYNCPVGFKGRDDRGFQSVTCGFEGVKGKSWMRQSTYGGRLCENVVQWLAWMLLCDALERTEEDPAFEIIGHTHDEIITLADESDTEALARLEGYMSVVEPWADGLIMAADGYEGKRYVKG
jgi:DNA polymerase